MRPIFFIVTLVCLYILPGRGFANETAQAVKDALVAHGFTVKNEKGDANAWEMTIASTGREEFVFACRLFPKMEDAQQAALRDATRVSAGVQTLAWSKDHLVCLHRQFLCGQKKMSYYKVESRSGDQTESLKRIYELVDPLL